MRLTATALLALALACFWLVGTFDGGAEPALEAAKVAPQPALVLVSLDGFRHDYLDRADVHAPTLRRLAKEGVRADGMVPVFPSVTLPNHWSIVTGLHPEAHGIVGNAFRDPSGRSFDGDRKTGALEPGWWGGEPIWAAAERQGIRSGTVFWPGSEAVPPSRLMRYDADLPYGDRVDTALLWLDEGTRFLTLYFEAVDGAGHEHGPDTPQTARAIERVDAALARLVSGLDQRGTLSRTNLVIVSDHGMTALSRDRLVFLDEAADLGAEAEEVIWDTPTQIWPRDGVDADALVARLDALDHVRAFRRERTPAHLHYRANDRIAPVVVIPDEGWSVTTRDRAEANPAFPIAGSHGFDPKHRAMHALFLAHGPSFRGGAEVGRIRTVDVYGILAGALGIEPASNAGDPVVAARVLR